MRILLVEDEPDLGAAIKRALNQSGYIVDWLVNGTDAWNHLETEWTQYTLGIFDWLLPGLSGIELLKYLRRRNHSLPVLMLTAKDSMEDKVTGLDAGADDYLVKPFGMPELLARIRALQRRQPQLQPEQLQVGNLTLDYSTNSVWITDSAAEKQVIPMTAKEFQLLEYFMRHPNQIVTRDQLLNQLWELGSEPLSNVVAAQIRLLRRKLAQSGGDRLIETVYGLGYRFNPNL
jgi:DNA-binding response OmpR family regulator